MKPKVKNIIFTVACIVFILTAIIVYVTFQNFSGGKEAIHIAVAGPVTGRFGEAGKVLFKGARLCADVMNERGGIDGRKIYVDRYDDRNNPAEAVNAAEGIAESPDNIVGVVGHYYSECSIAAGEIYKKHEIPAISPSSTDVTLTQDNPWYFRTVVNDKMQAKFLVNYAKRILREEKCSIIYENSKYGSYLAGALEESADELGLELMYKWEFDLGSSYIDRKLLSIVYDLRVKKDAGAVFLAVRTEQGIRLVKLIKDILIKNRLLAPDSFASKSFVDGFAEFRKEKKNPGFYSDGIYVATPLLYDTAGENAQKFRDRYREQYKEEPDWQAAFAFDSARLILESLNRAGMSSDTKKNRSAIRDCLASLDHSDKAVEGVTGLNYFTVDGDAVRPVSIGIYKNNEIIPAMTQIKPLMDFNEVPDFREALRNGRILLFGGMHAYKTNIVYTGIKLNKIKELDLKKLTCRIDFDIWFRFRGDIDVSDIEFPNAVEPITLGPPVEENVKDRLISRRYNVNGVFKSDFFAIRDAFGYHMTGFRFFHRKLSNNNVIFVADTLGMGLSDKTSYSDKIKQAHTVSPDLGWSVEHIQFFNNNTRKSVMGGLEYLDIPVRELDFSQFNFNILMRKDGFTVRRKFIPVNYTLIFIIISLSGIFLLRLAVAKKFKHLSKSFWLLETLLAFLLLLSGEIFLIELLTEDVEPYTMKIIVTSFDILWWLVPAYFLKLALEPFLWHPAEERNNRPVPGVLKRFLSYLIYFFATYGIIVNVFDQNITKLMATSGAIAMVIGFIVKANISNFFAGIMINQGDAIRIGDRVKIGSFDPGKVIDITWRSTKLLKGDGSLVNIPNASVSDSVVINYSSGDIYELDFLIHVDPSHSPERIRKILFDAVISTEGVLKDPEPSVRFKGFTEWSAQYGVGFSIGDYGKKSELGEAVMDRIWKHMNLAGIKPALRGQNKKEHDDDRKAHEKDIEPYDVLNIIDIFRPFPEEAKTRIARAMRSRHFPPRYTIVEQKEVGDSLFIIAEGVVSVRIGEERKEIVRMGAGSFFGEMALLTGAPRNATIATITDTYLFEITKEDIFPYLRQHPKILNRISEIMAERKMVEEPAKTQIEKGEIDQVTLTRQIFDKIRKFFE